MKQLKIVITGGPGTGKSSVIDRLATLKFTCMPEISRTVTRAAQKEGIEQLFLNEPLLFSQKLLEGRIRQYREAEQSGSEKVFFDRGIPDIHGYMDYSGTAYPGVFKSRSREFRYNFVFMMPPWREIYQTDNERYETFEQSLLIYDHLRACYSDMDYKVIVVPEGNIDQRVDFILNEL
ncbi:ATP-binding protein [Lutimonas saemankumensis]|uniref:AAA family ATPase n=1 Tax=Lutimonas saemankumensis TaxID=483016 RepID=UPI001CD3D396|nr:ATP-binding protein [Lutimonas saemankumensis]MCA0931687.1 ATP-binding protein [Lutimonas saemankumensis]